MTNETRFTLSQFYVFLFFSKDELFTPPYPPSRGGIKRAAPQWDAARFFAEINSAGHDYMTVTRLTVTPVSVATRTMYMPALNWAMFRI